MTTFGDFVKKRRLDLEIGLREFATKIGSDAANYSKIERGLKNAPTGDRLQPYVTALQWRIDSPEHEALDTLAHVANGEIPKKVLSDEALVAKLPILFDEMAKGKFTEEQVEKLLAIIRQAHTPEAEG